MANSLKRPLRRDTASAYGAWGGISNYVDAACAAVHSIAVRPVSWDTGRRHIAKNVPWMVTATSCDPCRSYRAASSYSSHAPSSRAAGAAGESCDLALSYPLPPPSSVWLLVSFSVWKALSSFGCR